jgi:flagellar biosynthesis protein FlhB
VAISAELTSGLLLLAGVLGLWLGGRALAGGLLNSIRLHLLGSGVIDLGVEESRAILYSLFGRAIALLGFFFVLLFVVAVLVGVLQVGFHVVPSLLAPRWEKLSPAAGWSRLLSMASAMRGMSALLKVTLVALLATWVLRGRLAQVITLGEGDLSSNTARAWDIVIRVTLAIAAALVLIGVTDYGFQFWRYEQALRMSRQELKEELRREEGDPQMRGRIRKMQRELSKKRMLRDVPSATVVITNPTRLAVALRYERAARMTAPRVVAKGAGYVAQRIVDLARRHAVPVVERKPVAQAIYKAVQVGQDIPEALYQAVAEVLAYVYRLRGAA